MTTRARWIPPAMLAVLLVLVLGACTTPDADEAAGPALAIPTWKLLSTANGDLPELGPSKQQTGSHVADLDGDGVNDFVIVTRVTGPSVTWYRRTASGWDKYIIDSEFLAIEAGGASHDIDGDGDLDLVFGNDASGNQMWWWENPKPDFSPDKNWTRRIIKNSGGNKHHDQAFGDVDGDGRAELVSWNQRDKVLLLFEIPEDPRATNEPWSYTPIYRWDEGEEHEGLDMADVNQDGKIDIVGGGRWFEHTGGTDFTPHLISDTYRFSRAAAAQIVEGGWLEIVFQPGDKDGALTWFEWNGTEWGGHELDRQVIHGHSLEVGDINGDGHTDIFSAEMGQWGGGPTVNPAPKIRIFYGDGQGGFTPTIPAEGFGNHESRIADLDGDGDLDILGKPYNWKTPRIDIWLQGPPQTGPLGLWRRHVIDYDKPWRAIYVGAGDVDGDGRTDVITGGWWYRNPGSLNGNWRRTDIGAPLNNMAAVADFDDDGDLDVLGTEGKASEANANFVWAQNDGSGQFTIKDNIPTADGDFLQGIAVGRLQNDRLQMALSWHQAGRGIQLLTVPDDPAGEVWGWRRVSEQSLDEELSEGDIDGDGDLDILMGTQWLENTGSEWTPHTLFEPTGMPDRNCLADVNGDGKLDSVVGYESMRAPTKLAWYEQGADPKGLWSEHVIVTMIGPMSMDCADTDNDGDIDVVLGQHNLVDPHSSRLIVFENAGNGSAWNEHVVWTGDEHHDGSQAVDMDGDGDLDIVSIGWTHPRVVIYENLNSE